MFHLLACTLMFTYRRAVQQVIQLTFSEAFSGHMSIQISNLRSFLSLRDISTALSLTPQLAQLTTCAASIFYCSTESSSASSNYTLADSNSSIHHGFSSCMSELELQPVLHTSFSVKAATPTPDDNSFLTF